MRNIIEVQGLRRHLSENKRMKRNHLIVIADDSMEFHAVPRKFVDDLALNADNGMRKCNLRIS